VAFEQRQNATDDRALRALKAIGVGRVFGEQRVIEFGNLLARGAFPKLQAVNHAAFGKHLIHESPFGEHLQSRRMDGAGAGFVTQFRGGLRHDDGDVSPGERCGQRQADRPRTGDQDIGCQIGCHATGHVFFPPVRGLAPAG
jgi:hypothetical protein